MFSVIVELIVSIRETVVEKTLPYQVSKTRHFQTCRYVLKTPKGPHPPQLQQQSHLMEPRTKQCLQLECLRLLLLAYFFAYHFCWRELWNEHRYQAATLCFFLDYLSRKFYLTIFCIPAIPVYQLQHVSYIFSFA